MEEPFDAIVVGAGLAGLASAYQMAGDGLSVLVCEKGKAPGAKNVSGGRMYAHALEKLIPNYAEEAPIERFVTREALTFLTDTDAVHVEYDSARLSKEKNSFNVLRAKFDPWLAKKAEERGAVIASETRVDDLWIENGACKGIVSGGDRFAAPVTILAEGANWMLTERAGLRKGPPDPEILSVGAKLVLSLPEDDINRRFGVASDEGVAEVLVGSFTRGVEGGGFLYTNKESVSLGVVVPLKPGMQLGTKNKAAVHEMVEDLRTHPYIARLLTGSELSEYSCHMIPERGIKAVPKRLVRDGLLVAGDAAGFVLNMGLSFRGMDLAIESGRLAGIAAREAKDAKDFSAGQLASYEKAVGRSFVMRDLKRFRRAGAFLSNPRMYTTYPELAAQLMHDIYHVDGEQERPSKIVRRLLRRNLSLIPALIKDALGGARAL